jgi:hypothetical protein
MIKLTEAGEVCLQRGLVRDIHTPPPIVAIGDGQPRPGVPDLFVLFRGIAHMIEIKTQAGELSDPQQSVMAAVLAGGGRVGGVRDAEEMLGLLDAWGIPRARRLAMRGSVAA